MACTIVGILSTVVDNSEIERAKRKPTENLDAYDLLLRGLANVYKWTREGNEEGLGMFCKAIELDPDFSIAHAEAASCLGRRKGFGWVIDVDQEIAEVRRLARRAVQLGKHDARTLAVAGYTLAYVARELEDGVALIDRALFLNPNLALAWIYSGWSRVWQGEFGRAIENFAHAMRLSPVDPLMF